MSKDVVRVGIVGGGRTGKSLYETLEKYSFVKVLGIADVSMVSPAMVAANEKGVFTTTDMDDLANMGDKLDLLFEVTGDPQVKKWLKLSFNKANNSHTIIVHDLIARLLISFGNDLESLADTFHISDDGIGSRWDWKMFST